MERLWIIGSILLVASLVFIVCSLALFVASRFFPTGDPPTTPKRDAKEDTVSPVDVMRQAG